MDEAHTSPPEEDGGRRSRHLASPPASKTRECCVKILDFEADVVTHTALLENAPNYRTRDNLEGAPRHFDQREPGLLKLIPDGRR